MNFEQEANHCIVCQFRVPVKCETKRNEAKGNETKSNETDGNETKRNEIFPKRNVTKKK